MRHPPLEFTTKNLDVVTFAMDFAIGMYEGSTPGAPEPEPGRFLGYMFYQAFLSSPPDSN